MPVTLLGTNACSPLATNALADNIWDNFSSQSYKDLPSVGDITWYHPYSGEARTYTMPAGGRGYTRPASLISVWSTAPFLLNNSVGRFESSPSVEARMRSFDDSIRQMLWPERRDKDSLLGDRIPGVIDRVGDRAPAGYDGGPAYVTVPAGYLPEFLQRTLGGEQRSSRRSSPTRASVWARFPRARRLACWPTSICCQRIATPRPARASSSA